jgi:hypothetical protein
LTTVNQKSSISPTTSVNWWKSTGLRTYALAWRSYERTMSSSASDVVSTTTGIRRRSGSAFTWARTLPSAQPRQVQVEEHEVGTRRFGVLPLPLEEPEGLLPVPYGVQTVRDLGLPKGLLGQADIGGVVLDQEDLDGGAALGSHRS